MALTNDQVEFQLGMRIRSVGCSALVPGAIAFYDDESPGKAVALSGTVQATRFVRARLTGNCDDSSAVILPTDTKMLCKQQNNDLRAPTIALREKVLHLLALVEQTQSAA
jgi:hypothetical protein